MGSLVEMLRWIIIVAAVVGIAFVACAAMGVPIPAWAVQMFWIVVIAIAALFAIRALTSIGPGGPKT
jgi:hypothetical protein